MVISPQLSQDEQADQSDRRADGKVITITWRVFKKIHMLPQGGIAKHISSPQNFMNHLSPRLKVNLLDNLSSLDYKTLWKRDNLLRGLVMQCKSPRLCCLPDMNFIPGLGNMFNPWANFLIFLRVRFLMCKMRLILLSSQGF